GTPLTDPGAEAAAGAKRRETTLKLPAVRVNVESPITWKASGEADRTTSRVPPPVFEMARLRPTGIPAEVVSNKRIDSLSVQRGRVSRGASWRHAAARAPIAHAATRWTQRCRIWHPAMRLPCSEREMF